MVGRCLYILLLVPLLIGACGKNEADNPVVKRMLADADEYITHGIPQQDLELLQRIIKYKRDCILYDEAKADEAVFLNEEKAIVKRMDRVVATRYK